MADEPRRGARAGARRAARASSALSVGPGRQRRRGAARAGRAAASRPTCSPTRRPPTTCDIGYVPAGYSLDDAAPTLRERDPDGYVGAVLDSMVAHVEAMLELQAARRGHLRLRQQPARPGRRPARPARGVRHPGLRARVHPPAVLRGRGPVPLGRALSGDPADIAATDEAVLRGVPATTRRCARWIAHGAREGAVPGAAGAHLLARVRRARRGWARASTGWSRRGEREGADRDRPRPPRRRLGRLAQPRDRGA